MMKNDHTKYSKDNNNSDKDKKWIEKGGCTTKSPWTGSESNLLPFPLMSLLCLNLLPVPSTVLYDQRQKKWPEQKKKLTTLI